METKLIYGLIPKVMESIGAIGKLGENKAQGYAFRKVDDMYNAIQPALVKHGVFITSSLLESKNQSFTSKSGTLSHHVTARVKYQICASDGSFVECVSEGEAIDTSDKATNKALTASFKYMLIQLFCIPVAELPDADKDSPEVSSDVPWPKPTEMLFYEEEAPILHRVDLSIHAPGASLGDYVVKFGKYTGKPLKDLDIFELENYVKFLKAKAKEDGRQLSGSTLEFAINADKFLESRTKERTR